MFFSIQKTPSLTGVAKHKITLDEEKNQDDSNQITVKINIL